MSPAPRRTSAVSAFVLAGLLVAFAIAVVPALGVGWVVVTAIVAALLVTCLGARRRRRND